MMAVAGRRPGRRAVGRRRGDIRAAYCRFGHPVNHRRRLPLSALIASANSSISTQENPGRALIIPTRQSPRSGRLAFIQFVLLAILLAAGTVIDGPYAQTQK